MSEREQGARMPREMPKWTGDDPLEREWPVRTGAGDGALPERPAGDPAAFEAPDPVRAPDAFEEDTEDPVAAGPVDGAAGPEPGAQDEPEPELPVAPAPELELESRPEDEAAVAARAAAEHAAGEIDIPDGYTAIEGYPAGERRAVAVVVSRFNGEVTNRMLASALAELERAGVEPGSVTVMPVPGAFELPLGAMALAKTRRYSCIVALGCVIRGETPHFDYVAGEAASGLQLAGIETGVPVAFGLLTCDTLAQAEARVDKGAEAVRTGLEMADVFAQVRAQAPV